jgi:hypothetical protein
MSLCVSKKDGPEAVVSQILNNEHINFAMNLLCKYHNWSGTDLAGFGVVKRACSRPVKIVTGEHYGI